MKNKNHFYYQRHWWIGLVWWLSVSWFYCFFTACYFTQVKCMLNIMFENFPPGTIKFIFNLESPKAQLKQWTQNVELPFGFQISNYNHPTLTPMFCKNLSANLSAKSLCVLTFTGPLSVSFVNVQVTGHLREKQQCHKLQEGRSATKSQEIWTHFLCPHQLPKQSIGWKKQSGDSCIGT